MLIATALLLAQLTQAQVELRLLVTGYRDGSPNLEMKIINHSDKPITLVLPGDGSEHGWRTPAIGWKIAVEDEEELLPQVAFGARCGNMNELLLADTFTLAPGQHKRTDSIWAFPPFPAPGRYRVALTYKNDPSMLMQAAAATPEALARVRSSMPIELVSNEVTIDWQPTPRPGTRQPVIEGELSPQLLAHISSCLAPEPRCSGSQRRLVEQAWQRCVGEGDLAAARAAEDAKLSNLVAARDMTIAKLEPRADDVDGNGAKLALTSLSFEGDALVFRHSTDYSSIVAVDKSGKATQLFFHRRPIAVASCDATRRMPELLVKEQRSTWTVIPKPSALGPPTNAGFDFVRLDFVEIPMPKTAVPEVIVR